MDALVNRYRFTWNNWILLIINVNCSTCSSADNERSRCFAIHWRSSVALISSVTVVQWHFQIDLGEADKHTVFWGPGCWLETFFSWSVQCSLVRTGLGRRRFARSLIWTSEVWSQTSNEEGLAWNNVSYHRLLKSIQPSKQLLLQSTNRWTSSHRKSLQANVWNKVVKRWFR